jgi:hypothetical protein
MAQVTPERIEQARTAWKRAIGGYFHDLIDAQRGRPS